MKLNAVGTASAAVAALAAVVLIAHGGADASEAAATTETKAVSFEANAGTEKVRILNLGGLVLRAPAPTTDTVGCTSA